MTYQTFNISLPKDLVAAMDAAAHEDYRTRSDLIREAVRAHLIDAQAWNALFSYGKNRVKQQKIRSQRDVARIVSAYRRGK